MQTNVYSGDLTTTSATDIHGLGTVRTEPNGKSYRWVKVIDAAVSNGWALCAASASDPNVVSGDRSGGSSINSIPRGVAVGSIAQNYYGWIQVSGIHTSVLSDGSVNAGEAVVAHASTDGGVDSAAVGSTEVITNHQKFGLAMANDTTSRVKLLVQCL